MFRQIYWLNYWWVSAGCTALVFIVTLHMRGFSVWSLHVLRVQMWDFSGLHTVKHTSFKVQCVYPTRWQLGQQSIRSL